MKKLRQILLKRQVNELKQALELLHKEVKNAENYFKHIYWLQERFPLAKYEDVTGLCKLATQEEVAKQDYSLNPGRYVGIIIEEDGKTQEEFFEYIYQKNEFLNQLILDASNLNQIINSNLKSLLEA